MRRISDVARKSPDRLAALAAVFLFCTAGVARGGAPLVSLWPHLRPAALKIPPKGSYRQKGSVCGIATIIGARLKPIFEDTRGCGIAKPVQVTSVSGILPSPAAVTDCATAKALSGWADRSAKPAFRATGGGLVGLHVAASYVCRTRNSQVGAKISQHALGHAVDISAFEFRDGSSVTVLDGWNISGNGKTLKRLHRNACGPFGSVLGPKSDSFHRDHFHFDTARYRDGSYCR